MDPLTFEILFRGKPVQVVLANLPWKRVAGIVVTPEELSAESLAHYRESNLFWSAETIDGMTATRARREALAADPAAGDAILTKRHEILNQLRGAGRMYAQCPHCRAGEVEMSLLSLFDTLGVLPPDMISADHRYFLPPVASEWDDPPVRPDHFAYASRIRFDLPTHRLGLPRASFEAGILDRASVWRSQPARERWQTDGINGPRDQLWRDWDRVAFRATIWLIAAIRELVPLCEPTIEAFEELPAVDFYFLDALYRLTFDTSVSEHAVPRACPACARTFIPVAPLIWENTPP